MGHAASEVRTAQAELLNFTLWRLHRADRTTLKRLFKPQGVSVRNATPYPGSVIVMRVAGVTPAPAGPVLTLVDALMLIWLAA